MKRKGFTFFVFLLVVLTGCQAGGGNGAVDSNTMIEVEFGTNPEDNLQLNESVELYVKVTQDGKPVEDADDVAFEIWHEDDEAAQSDEHDDHDNGDHDGDGHDSDENHNGHGDHDHDDMYREGSEVITAEHQGDGIYSIEKTFDRDGVHFVMYHVTARSYHAMKAEEVHIQ